VHLRYLDEGNVDVNWVDTNYHEGIVYHQINQMLMHYLDEGNAQLNFA
jgi:hypothetical protein